MFKKISLIGLCLSLLIPVSGAFNYEWGRHYHRNIDSRMQDFAAIQMATDNACTFYADYESDNAEIDAFFSIMSSPMSLEQAFAEAPDLIRKTASQVTRLFVL